MNNEELNVFLDTISENGTPETLENVLKTKNYIGELNDKITNLTNEIETLNNSIVAKTELISKYEKLVRDYVKTTPVETASPCDTVSNYDDFLED